MKNYCYHHSDIYGHEAYCTATGADGRKYKTVCYNGMISLYVQTSATIYERANTNVYASHVAAIHDCDNCH